MNAYLGKYPFVFLSILELPAYLGSTYLASMNPPNIREYLRRISLTTRNLNMLCCRSMALNYKERKKFTHLQYDPILICLARNCKRTATAAVAALVQRRKIVGQTLKKRSWWSCLEKMKISCDTKPSAPLNGCRLLASCTRGARNKT